MEISRTSRILATFHLFMHCHEVCYKEFKDFFGEYMTVNPKTVRRDTDLLTDAGVLRKTYSHKLKAYVPPKGKDSFIPKPFEKPVFPASKAQKTYMEKIIRLCTLMTEMWGDDDPYGWYDEHYPDLGVRTRQRDFEELHKISYEIWYTHADESPDGMGHYNCRIPSYAYDFYFNK